MIKTSIKLKKRINLSNSSLSIFLSLVSKQLNKIAYFGINDESITKLKNHIKLVDPNLEVLLFPSFDCTFFSNVSPTTDLLHERINTLYNLIFTNNKRTILLGSMNALVTQTIPKTKFKDKFVVIKSDSKNFYGILKKFFKRK